MKNLSKKQKVTLGFLVLFVLIAVLIYFIVKVESEYPPDTNQYFNSEDVGQTDTGNQQSSNSSMEIPEEGISAVYQDWEITNSGAVYVTVSLSYKGMKTNKLEYTVLCPDGFYPVEFSFNGNELNTKEDIEAYKSYGMEVDDSVYFTYHNPEKGKAKVEITLDKEYESYITSVKLVTFNYGEDAPGHAGGNTGFESDALARFEIINLIDDSSDLPVVDSPTLGFFIKVPDDNKIKYESEKDWSTWSTNYTMGGREWETSAVSFSAPVVSEVTLGGYSNKIVGSILGYAYCWKDGLNFGSDESHSVSDNDIE